MYPGRPGVPGFVLALRRNDGAGATRMAPCWTTSIVGRCLYAPGPGRGDRPPAPRIASDRASSRPVWCVSAYKHIKHMIKTFRCKLFSCDAGGLLSSVVNVAGLWPILHIDFRFPLCWAAHPQAGPLCWGGSPQPGACGGREPPSPWGTENQTTYLYVYIYSYICVLFDRAAP